MICSTCGNAVAASERFNAWRTGINKRIVYDTNQAAKFRLG